MFWKDDVLHYAQCPLCGGRAFRAGPNKRMNQGLAPCCLGCFSLERHRIINACYRALPPAMLRACSCLHFAPDRAVEPGWFASYEASTYGGENSLDLEAIDRPDDTYDWIICNHVLEHLPDDVQGMREMLRVAKPEGVVQFAIPSPLYRKRTEDWGGPDSRQHGHWRIYGEDFMDRFVGVLTPENVLSVTAIDPVTGARDVLFFTSRSPGTLQALRRWFTATPKEEGDVATRTGG